MHEVSDRDEIIGKESERERETERGCQTPLINFMSGVHSLKNRQRRFLFRYSPFYVRMARRKALADKIIKFAQCVQRLIESL